MIYYKRYTGKLLSQKTAEQPSWVQWTHHSEGKTHCPESLMLDGCWFLEGKAPPCSHHPFCHCTLEAIDYAIVLANATVYSSYSKFDPYLFNTDGLHPNGKAKLFKEWGYTVEDARWLQAEIERQAKERYIASKYTLGKLNWNGHRIRIRVIIPRRDGTGEVSFITGWMVEPGGKLRMTTPYGGK